MVEFLKTITLLMLVFKFFFILYKIYYHFLFLKTKNKMYIPMDTNFFSSAIAFPSYKEP